MKLNQKVLIFIGLPWICLLLAIDLSGIQTGSRLYYGLSILCAITIYLLIRLFLTSRLKKLDQEIVRTNNPYSFIKHILIKGNDEIVSIATHINFLQDTIYTLRSSQHEENIKDDTINLDKLNLALSTPKVSPNNIMETISLIGKEGMTQLSHYDELTSLPNRVFFSELLNKSMSHAKRHNKILAILFIDIDSFHNINIGLGKAAGDEVLKEISKRIISTLRTEDAPARLDADQFIILLSDIHKPKFASTVAEKLLKACSQPFFIANQEIALTVSIGICIYPFDGSSLEDILENADKALYQAKQMGGNVYHFYTQTMDAEAREYIQLETALRNAIQNNELVLYYQPKIQINKGDIVGVEALIRWAHPSLGILSPDKFIPLAEETGLITQIGEWTLREACKTSKYWHNEGYEHMTIAVNLSPKQFYPEFASTITTILAETGLNPEYLELEITETAVMDNANSAISVLEALKATGVRISLDHFGTGYTSISHLKKFPISSIKIDQSFIKGVPNNPNDTAIAGALIALAHNLGFSVVAEGVETAEQVQALGSLKCDIVQGYFLSHPLPAQKIMLQFKKLADSIF